MKNDFMKASKTLKKNFSGNKMNNGIKIVIIIRKVIRGIKVIMVLIIIKTWFVTGALKGFPECK